MRPSTLGKDYNIETNSNYLVQKSWELDCAQLSIPFTNIETHEIS